MVDNLVTGKFSKQKKKKHFNIQKQISHEVS